ncbi:MAG: SurA N-terminal domain-containing protein [Thermodesulfobacteriaceae bacterium]|nr:SurA N-terminal domain-containing protein [Thermodesulfobacteriaceae bacterium]MCX8042101.1 SurA N-terminal domain-containing protein [Thermodesulfobacteriaceae bacterium]MDW8136489.1 SurA N-terminal domain-containing protein [Thermodesulfobacterium sp.]
MKRAWILIFLLFLFWIKTLKAEVVNQIVAVIGEDFLTLYELDELCKPYFDKFIKAELSLIEKENLKNQIRKRFLEQWVEETVIKREAKKYGISVSDKELEEYLNYQIKEIGGKEKLEDFLQKEGISYENYKERLRDDILKIRFIQWQVREKILITDEELKKMYQQEIEKYSRIPQYWLSILIINGEQSLAEVIYKELLTGISMEEIFQKYSPSLQYIKEVVFKEDEIALELLKELKKLNPGELTFPLKREKSYQILKLLKKTEGIPPSYEELKESLYQQLFLKKTQEFIEKWIKELKEKKYIRIYL